jgi:hypothetical protein
VTVRIDERVARCFGLLRQPEFTPLRTYLQDMRTELMENAMGMRDDTMIHRTQGKVEALKDLIEHIEKSDVLLAKTRQQR